jgi:hypothetical protein
VNLALQQQALLEALWQPRHADATEFIATRAVLARARGQNHWERGLKAYRSNGQELAQRALGAAYPVVAQLLGEDNFHALARALWRQHPPQRGDVAQWGGALAQLIAALPDLAGQEPYLADVARAEWALHLAAAAPDAGLDAASFALIAQSDPAHIALVLAPGTAAIASTFPVASILLAHLGAGPSLQEAGQLLRDQCAETALVWREGLKPRLRLALPGEHGFIRALQDRRSLLEAVQAAGELELDAWMGLAAQTGLLLGARTLSHEGTS